MLFFVFCLFGWGLFSGCHFLATALNLKDSIFSGAQAGIGHMTKAQQDLADQNTEAAASEFQLAYNSFSLGQRQLTQGNAEMSDILNVLPQTKAANNLLQAAALVSQSGQEMVKFYQTASGLNFSAQGLEGGKNPQETFSILKNSLDTATTNLAAANQKLSDADLSLVPSSKRAEFVELSSKLQQAQTALNNFKQILGILNSILVPKGTALILFENNNELRPAGGFIGTYGLANLESGKINNLAIGSIYDLDGQLVTKVSPPNPLLNVNDQWYMRDSNWFADFQASAQKAVDFYEMEGGQTPNTIIALTPNVVVSLLNITGPVYVSTFNTTLTADNFVEKTQAISTVSDNLTLNQPKQILADFFPLFMQKLKTLSVSQNKQVLAGLFAQLQQKQIVLESSDPAVQSQLEAFNWAGRVFYSDRDYLQMVSANLGGTKTDLYLQKKLSLKTVIAKDGSIINDLTLTVTNQLPNMEDATNTSFIRFLVPQNSKLLSVTGFDSKDLDGLQNNNYRQDPQVTAWQSGLIKDVSSGTLIGQESNKTFFGNWLSVAGGQTRVIHLTYQLPFKLKDPDRYSLVLQKQIGSVATQFNWSVNFDGKQLQWESFNPDNIEANNLTKSVNLDKDYFFGLVLQNR